MKHKINRNVSVELGDPCTMCRPTHRELRLMFGPDGINASEYLDAGEVRELAEVLLDAANQMVSDEARNRR